ncbi:MAG: hypothetical protein ACPG4N_03050 [Gammaproteobacteria bacterium]
MIKTSIAFAAGILFSGLAQANVEAVPFPSDALDDSDTRVAAFYQSRCDGYAQAQGLSAEQQQLFVTNCLSNAPSVWTLGTEESGD